jgi:predicted nuclease of restriction endonuclease-like (RecB) superfamily
MSNIQTNELQYKELLIAVKNQIRSSQIKASYVVNSTLTSLYWQIGEMIAQNQTLFVGRNSYVDQLAKDIQSEFPDIKGFSKRNLFLIRQFYLFYSSVSVQQVVALKLEQTENVEHNDDVISQQSTTEISVQQPVALKYNDSNQRFRIVQQLVALIPWGHHVLLLSKLKAPVEVLFYLQQTIELNWSRSVLTLQIEQNLFARLGKAVTNFKTTLPEKQAQMAQQMLKDPYNFGFLTLEPEVQELEIEKQLTEHITKFLLEQGKGFAFIGRQYPLEVGNKDYRLDLLFYHIRLRCFIVIELKSGEFQPEYAGKMNFYLSAVDDLLKQDTDQPTIGIILCKNKNGIEVEYTLRGMNRPIGVSEFTVSPTLPAELKSNIPTVEEFENELNRNLE